MKELQHLRLEHTQLQQHCQALEVAADMQLQQQQAAPQDDVVHELTQQLQQLRQELALQQDRAVSLQQVSSKVTHGPC